MSFLSKLDETQEFATLPKVATKILQLLEDENIDLRQLAKLIESDVSLTLKILKVSNSPLFATKTEITSITQAIATLGLNRLTNIVLGISIFSRFLLYTHKETQKLIKEFWWHSSCTGIVSKTLASKISSNFKEIEFLGGLLHEIGKLAMIQLEPTKYFEVLDLINNNGMMDIDAEYKVYGINHLEVGAVIADNWKLPKNIKYIISNHNYPDKIQEYQDLVAVVRFSDILCEIWGAGIYEGFKIISLQDEISWKVLLEYFPELKDMDIEVFTFELEQDFKASKEFLSLISNE